MNAAYQNSAYGASNLASYVQQKTLSAGPLELVVMLYAKTIEELKEARRQLADRNIALRSKAISKACDLIGELDGALNIEAGGELAHRLRGLYRYCLVRLLDANLHQADEPLSEVLGLMATLSEGWQTIAQSESGDQRIPEPAPVKVPTLPWDMASDIAGDIGKGATDRSHSWTL
jgi:flagellar protein FliS